MGIATLLLDDREHLARTEGRDQFRLEIRIAAEEAACLDQGWTSRAFHSGTERLCDMVRLADVVQPGSIAVDRREEVPQVGDAVHRRDLRLRNVEDAGRGPQRRGVALPLDQDHHADILARVEVVHLVSRREHPGGTEMRLMPAATALMLLSTFACSTEPLPGSSGADSGTAQSADAPIDRLHGDEAPRPVPGDGVGYGTADIDPPSCADYNHSGAAPIAVVTDVGYLVTYLSREAAAYCLEGGTPEQPEYCGAAPPIELTRLSTAGRLAQQVACDANRIVLLVQPPDGARWVVVDQGGWDGWFPVDGWATAVHGVAVEAGTYTLVVQYVDGDGSVIDTERAEGYVAG